MDYTVKWTIVNLRQSLRVTFSLFFWKEKIFIIPLLQWRVKNSCRCWFGIYPGGRVSTLRDFQPTNIESNLPLRHLTTCHIGPLIGVRCKLQYKINLPSWHHRQDKQEKREKRTRKKLYFPFLRAFCLVHGKKTLNPLCSKLDKRVIWSSCKDIFPLCLMSVLDVLNEQTNNRLSQNQLFYTYTLKMECKDISLLGILTLHNDHT